MPDINQVSVGEALLDANRMNEELAAEVGRLRTIVRELVLQSCLPCPMEVLEGRIASKMETLDVRSHDA